MNNTRTVLDREVLVEALRHMSEEDLLFLNDMVVERLNLLAQPATPWAWPNSRKATAWPSRSKTAASKRASSCG